MNLLQFPDIVGMYQGAKTAGLERQVANSVVSSAYSGWLTFLWRSGSSRWAIWTGEGPAMQDAAVAMYLSLRELEKKDFLTLTLPSDMLTPEVLSKFQTEEVTK